MPPSDDTPVRVPMGTSALSRSSAPCWPRRPKRRRAASAPDLDLAARAWVHPTTGEVVR